MSSTVPPTPHKTALEILLILVGDEADIGAFVQAVIACAAAEKTATTYLQHLKAAEPAAELAAGLADKLKGQL